jgi:hypothetical protein
MTAIARITVVLTLALLALTGCDLFGDDTVIVQGTVIDGDTGEPLSGVQAVLEVGASFGGSAPDRLDSDRTSSDGTYELETVTDKCLELFSGLYVEARSDDYGYRSAGAECASGTQVINIEMTPRSL